MATEYQPSEQPLTHLEKALAARLKQAGWPVVTPYALFHELRSLYASGRKLYLRKHLPDHEDLGLRRSHLVSHSILFRDPDYGGRAYRVVANSDRPPEDIVCLIDRFSYVSHLSAMARYGLTDRRPTELHVTTVSRRALPALVEKAMQQDYGPEELKRLNENQVVPLRSIRHPENVRNRTLRVHETSTPRPSIEVGGAFARMSTIGATFIDTLEHPRACGGMPHVLDVWKEHADLYRDEIINAVDHNPRPIIKVRAGYILEELLAIRDDRVENWAQYAQRGSSRILDPERSFTPIFSEKWMLSINA